MLAKDINRLSKHIAATGIIVCCVVAAISGCSQQQSDISRDMSAEQAEALYLQRFASLTDRTSRSGLSVFDTLVPIEGAENWTPLPRATQAQRTVADSAIRAIEDYAARNNSDTLIVWRDGVVEAERYFNKATPDTLFNAKSFAKPLSVIAVGRAIAEGHIESLDQPVAAFIDEWRDTAKEKILISDLLGMRSGLLAQSPAPTADNILNRVYLHPYHDKILINEYPLVSEPGTRYDYSNANADLVAPLIERATGVQYEDWLADAVLKPLGARGGEIWMNRLGGTAHSGCCVMLPIEVHLRTAILVLQDGIWEGTRLLPEGFVKAMRTPTPQNSHVGMGLYIGSPYLQRRGFMNPEKPYGKVLHSEPYLADDLVLFDGNSNQVAYIIPSQKLVILRSGSWPPAEPEWDNAFIPNTVLRSLAE